VYFEPQEIAIAYVGAAAAHGARLLPNRAVTGIRSKGGRVVGVDTVSQPIDAPIVIDAAGAWAGEIARHAGFPVPMIPTRHQLLITEPIADVRPEHAIVRIVDASVYGRPAWGGFLLGGYEPDPLTIDAAALPETFEARDTPLDIRVLRRMIDRVAATLPALADAPVRHHRGGVPTMTVDGHHLVGPVPGADGMWMAAGCNVAGLSIAPVIGEQLAEWIVDGAPSHDLAPMAVTRFGPEWADAERVREAAAGHYATFYRSTI
jgi:4-methylaminobutanoate oxidase (formaldehyde-forming)